MWEGNPKVVEKKGSDNKDSGLNTDLQNGDKDSKGRKKLLQTKIEVSGM